MKTQVLAIAMCLVTVNAYAKEKPLPLAEKDASSLDGKVVVVTRHEKPSFVAMTAGKAAFALLGAGAMIAAGNQIVKENEIADPADVLEHELVPAIAKQYHLQVKSANPVTIKPEKPKEIAATQADADYILDLRSGGWQFAYYPTEWGKYWVAYSVQVRLIDAKSAAVVSNMGCTANTNKHAASPTKEALLADKAQLLKDVTGSLGWICVQLLGKEQFLLPAEAIPAAPAQYTDPLTAYAAHGNSTPADGGSAPPAQPTAPAEAQQPTTPGESAPAPTSGN
jgi:hypothetical protein